MQFSAFIVFVSAVVSSALAATTSNLERRIHDPGNPANLISCPPGGTADACNLEQLVSISLLRQSTPAKCL